MGPLRSFVDWVRYWIAYWYQYVSPGNWLDRELANMAWEERCQAFEPMEGGPPLLSEDEMEKMFQRDASEDELEEFDRLSFQYRSWYEWRKDRLKRDRKAR